MIYPAFPDFLVLFSIFFSFVHKTNFYYIDIGAVYQRQTYYNKITIKKLVLRLALNFGAGNGNRTRMFSLEG